MDNILSSEFTLRFIINFISLLVLLRAIYYRNNAQRESLAGFMVFGNGVFFVTALLHNVEMSMGFAFGLFAVFSMLRYRTETLTVRDMTYLFVLIAISLMSSVSSLHMYELILVNGSMCAIAAFCETSYLAKKTLSKQIIYEKIALIKPENKALLYQDLQNRLGIKINNIEVGDIDFLKDCANIKVFYQELPPVLQTDTQNQTADNSMLNQPAQVNMIKDSKC